MIVSLKSLSIAKNFDPGHKALEYAKLHRRFCFLASETDTSKKYENNARK